MCLGKLGIHDPIELLSRQDHGADQRGKAQCNLNLRVLFRIELYNNHKMYSTAISTFEEDVVNSLQISVPGEAGSRWRGRPAG